MNSGSRIHSGHEISQLGTEASGPGGGEARLGIPLAADAEEVEANAQAGQYSHEIAEEAFSNKIITPGKTTLTQGSGWMADVAACEDRRGDLADATCTPCGDGVWSLLLTPIS
jgi:hypothetical protein